MTKRGSDTSDEINNGAVFEFLSGSLSGGVMSLISITCALDSDGQGPIFLDNHCGDMQNFWAPI